MYIDQLVYFLHVAETGSINSAAQKFYMTQQAINASIKKMEAELDTPLINRSNKGVTLTSQGHIFAVYARKIVEQYEESVHVLRQFNASGSDLRGTLSIFSASIFTNLFLPEVIRDFMQIYPNTIIRIIEINNDELLSYVQNQYCEVAMISASKAHIEKELNRYPGLDVKQLSLMEDKVVLCMRPDHFLMKFKGLQKEEQYEFGTNGRLRYSLYQVLSDKMEEEDVWKTAISNSGNAELHKKLIMEGVAVTYMPQLAYEYEFKQEGFVALPILDCHPVNHCLLYHDDPADDNYKLVQTFIKFLQKSFEKRFGVYIPANKA